MPNADGLYAVGSEYWCWGLDESGNSIVEGGDGSDKEWNVAWSKTYVATGTEKIVARSQEEAEAKMVEMIGDLEGSMQLTDNDTIEASPVVG